MDPKPILVGDVGGTHTRFATVGISDTSWVVSHRFELEVGLRDLPTALRIYFDRAGMDAIPDSAVIAAAGPVSGGKVILTNRALEIRESDLIHFGFERVKLINDFAALAFAADILQPDDLHSIGPPVQGRGGEPISVLGPGTGFGISCLVRDRGRAIALATEGGHIGFAPADDQQKFVLSKLEQRFGRVTVEHILSGPGLQALHQALHGREDQALPAEAISAGALGADAACRRTVSLFCSILGVVAGDIALVHGARGGVLIGGGIAPQVEPLLQEGAFRRMFEDKGRMSAYVSAIPTQLIVNPNAALIGAARAGFEEWGARK